MANRPEPPKTADLSERFGFADAALQNGRLSQAFEAVENILAISPDNQRALELKQKIRQALEQQEQPEPPPPPPEVPTQPVQPVRPAGPTTAQKAQALVADAGLAIGGKDVERARSLISEGKQLDPSNPRWSQLERQVVNLEQELEQESIEEQRAQIIAGYLTQATQAIGAEDYDRAIAAYDEIIKQEPNHAGAVTGKAQALNLKRQVERVAAARHIIHSKTEFVAPPGQPDRPKGFESGGVKVKAATRAARFPGELIIELNPTNAQPGNPYVLRVRVANQGNRPVHVKSLEIVSTYSGKSTGKGQQIPARVQRIDPRASVLLHEVDGTWTEEQNQGRITATVTLVGDAKLIKTISW
jgi:tetratricopeptide (TPR) repeat protein